MKLDLVFPCSEDTSKMANTKEGKFCGQCNKEVIDFTLWKKEDIIQYLSKKKSCGIFRNDQLDKIKSNPIFHIRPRYNLFHKAVASLTILCLALVGCEEPKQPRHSLGKLKTPLKDSRTTSCNRTVGVPVNTGSREEKDIETGEVQVEHLVGDTMLQPPISGMMVLGGAEIDAEFPGGEDSMLNFLAKNIQYPSYEKKNRIEGILYATFTIDIDGSIEEIEIVKTVEGSKGFDAEVIRVLQLMPKWNPGKVNDEFTQSCYTLPISFDLD